MKRRLALLAAACMLLSGCGSKGKVVGGMTAELTTEPTTIPDNNYVAAQTAAVGFAEAISEESVGKLVKYSDIDMLYFQANGEMADSDTLIKEYKDSFDATGAFYEIFKSIGTVVKDGENCDEILPYVNKLIESGEFADNMRSHYKVDKAYKFSLEGGYLYVLHINGDWKADIALTPYFVYDLE